MPLLGLEWDAGRWTHAQTPTPRVSQGRARLGASCRLASSTSDLHIYGAPAVWLTGLHARHPEARKCSLEFHPYPEMVVPP